VSRSSGSAPNNVAAMARDILSFLDSLGETRVDLLGFSLGGMVAQQVLLDRPALVRRAVLVGTGAPDAVNIMNAEVTAAATRVPSDARALLFLFFEPTRTSQEAGTRYLHRISSRSDREPATSVELMHAQLEAMRAWASVGEARAAALEGIQQPVLVVNGSHDRMIPTINAFTLWRRLPSAQLILYPDSGHGALFQYFTWFVDDVSRFLDRP